MAAETRGRLSHATIWAAIDRLAARYELSPSALARRAGLDPTTFNRSKRIASDGRPRWPSTESIAKILDATGARFEDFVAALAPHSVSSPRRARSVPVLGNAQAGAGGFFEESGFPAGQGWDEVVLPDAGNATYALKVTGDSMLPLYRDGDTIVVSQSASTKPGDRVVVRTKDGEVMAKVLRRRTARTIELASLNPEHPARTLRLADVDWIARILWASQ